MQAIAQFLARLSTDPPVGSQVRSLLTLPPVQASHRDFPAHFPAWLVDLLRAQGIVDLAEHQWQALHLLRQERHVCLTAPTGGGKGVVRLLAVYQSLGLEPHGHGLYISASKDRQLAQLKTIAAWNDLLPLGNRLSAAIYDGDTPRTQRQAIRQSLPRLLLTTPEMLHAGILAYHSGWRAFLQALRYIVLVDVHECSGALGSHMAHLLRRVQRLTTHYGAQPQYLLTSAPLAHIAEAASTLTGHTCVVVPGPVISAQHQSRVLLESDADPVMLCRELVTRQREVGLQSLLLAPHGLIGESDDSPQLAVPQRPLTHETFTTTALRLLHGEYAAIVLPHTTPVATVRPSTAPGMIFLGLPSSLTRLHEHLALLASSHAYSVSTLIVQGKTPLERYLLRYPAVYQTPWLQELVLHMPNARIARHHLHCAAAELAVRPGERYAGLHDVDDILQQLAQDKAITRRKGSEAWVATQRSPQRQAHLRSYTPMLRVVNTLDGQLLARVTPAQALREYFAGARFRTSDGKTFQVEPGGQDNFRITARPIQADYATRGIVNTTVTEPSVEAAITKETFRLTYGACTSTESLRAYERLTPDDAAVRAGIHILPERQRHYRTQGVWLTVTQHGTVYIKPLQVVLHTLVHAVRAGLPLLLIAEAEDLRGGVYEMQDTKDIVATFLDAHPGGNGVSACLYREHEQVLRIALQLLLQCDCTHSCVKCLTAQPCDTCGTGVALDRQAGMTVLQQMLGEAVPPFMSPTLAPRAEHDRAPRHMYLALSTQQSAEDVGGWQHKQLLGLGVAVTYDTQDGRYRTYTAESVQALLANLHEADLVIGFNTRDFDYQVLQPYTDVPLTTLPTLAILDDIQQTLGFRLSLRHVVKETLDIDRPDDSMQTLHWYREGDRPRIAQQCRRDLDLVRDLVRHGGETGTIFYRDRSGARSALPVHWQFAEHYG